MELKALICPQCGSADVEQLTELRCRCSSCGSTFLIEGSAEGENFCPRIQLPTAVTKEQFLREVWRHISLSDPPEEVYDCDLSAITLTQKEILVGCGEGRVDLQASIGYDRKETYTDTERYYDSEKKQTCERPVTKTRTVTDWQAYSTSVTEAAFAAVTNDASAEWESGRTFDLPDGIGTPQAGGVPHPNAQKELEERLLHGIGSAAERDLPGDQQKDISWSIDRFSVYDAKIYIAPEHSALLTCGGKTVRYYSYAFDKLSVCDTGTFQKPEAASVSHAIRQAEESIPKKIGQLTRPRLLLSAAALVLSVLVSLLVRSYVPIVLVFVLAVAAFIWSQITCNKIERQVRSEVRKECDRLTAASLEQNRTLLDRKLKSLGLQSLSGDE